MRLLADMREDGVPPNDVVLNAAVDACGKVTWGCARTSDAASSRFYLFGHARCTCLDLSLVLSLCLCDLWPISSRAVVTTAVDTRRSVQTCRAAVVFLVVAATILFASVKFALALVTVHLSAIML